MASFFFNIVFVINKMNPSWRTQDGALRSISAGFTLLAAESMAYVAGFCINPAIAIGQVVLRVGLITYKPADDVIDPATLRSDEAKFLWVYAVFPFIAAVCAGVFVKFSQ